LDGYNKKMKRTVNLSEFRDNKQVSLLLTKTATKTVKEDKNKASVYGIMLKPEQVQIKGPDYIMDSLKFQFFVNSINCDEENIPDDSENVEEELSGSEDAKSEDSNEEKLKEKNKLKVPVFRPWPGTEKKPPIFVKPEEYVEHGIQETFINVGDVITVDIKNGKFKKDAYIKLTNFYALSKKGIFLKADGILHLIIGFIEVAQPKFLKKFEELASPEIINEYLDVPISNNMFHLYEQLCFLTLTKNISHNEWNYKQNPHDIGMYCFNVKASSMIFAIKDSKNGSLANLIEQQDTKKFDKTEEFKYEVKSLQDLVHESTSITKRDECVIIENYKIPVFMEIHGLCSFNNDLWLQKDDWKKKLLDNKTPDKKIKIDKTNEEIFKGTSTFFLHMNHSERKVVIECTPRTKEFMNSLLITNLVKFEAVTLINTFDMYVFAYNFKKILPHKNIEYEDKEPSQTSLFARGGSRVVPDLKSLLDECIALKTPSYAFEIAGYHSMVNSLEVNKTNKNNFLNSCTNKEGTYVDMTNVENKTVHFISDRSDINLQAGNIKNLDEYSGEYSFSENIELKLVFGLKEYVKKVEPNQSLKECGLIDIINYHNKLESEKIDDETRTYYEYAIMKFIRSVYYLVFSEISKSQTSTDDQVTVSGKMKDLILSQDNIHYNSLTKNKKSALFTKLKPVELSKLSESKYSSFLADIVIIPYAIKLSNKRKLEVKQEIKQEKVKEEEETPLVKVKEEPRDEELDDDSYEFNKQIGKKQKTNE
jgi:hypothetical protein